MAWTFYTDGAEKTSLSTVPNNAVRAKTAVAQSQGSGTTYATLAFELEDYDYGGMHSNVTNNSRLYAQADGVYLIEGVVNWATSTSGDRSAAIRLGGTTNIATSTDVTQSTATLLKSSYVSAHYNLTAGQYVELRVFQNSGGALGLDTSNPTSFSMALVSPLSGGGGGGGGGSMSTLTDVDVSSAVDGSLIRYESGVSQWQATTAANLLLNDAGNLVAPVLPTSANHLTNQVWVERMDMFYA